MKLKKLTSLLVLVLLMLHTTSFATDTQEANLTEQPQSELNIYCKSCVLVECSTHKIAYEKNSEEKLYPASTTKLLTAIITLQKCELTDTVTITSDMINQIPAGYTIAYLQPGETISIEQLLYLLLIPSANDAGFALAIHISGSIDSFAQLMNETAKSLGCTNSNFTNPSGIHNDNHYSTAKDMSLIGLKAIEYPLISQIGSLKEYTYNSSNGTSRRFTTTNTLIQETEKNYYEYATGLKTGFTSPAGSCIVATAQKDNMKFLAVVLGAPEPDANINYRDADCKTLFDYGFENYEELIKITETFFKTFSRIIFGNNLLNKILKTLIIFTTFIVFFKILRHKHIKKAKKSNIKNEFNFKCLNW